MQFIDLHEQYKLMEAPLKRRLDSILENKHFIGGEEVGELEARLAEYTGVKHVIACASGTDALTIPLRAYGIKEDDAVFVPSFTFFASGESVTLAGGTPVFVDVDRDTFNIDPVSLEQKIEETKKDGRLRPRGIIAVDLFGQPAEHDSIQKIAEKNGLFILEDAAQGFGGNIKGKKAGSFGNVAGTSFFPAKPLGCYGDGGAIFTDDDELAAVMKSVHVHGQGTDKYDNVRIGLNSRLDTIQAAVLLEKMELFDDELKARDEIAARYEEKMSGIVKTPVVKEGYFSSWAQYTIQVGDDETRTRIIEALKEKDIPAMIYYPIPMHMSTAYSSDGQNTSLPVSEELRNKVMSLPMHPYLKEEDQDKICAVISEVLGK